MPAISATAHGKIILLGDHAVVYGRPAIAIPVDNVSVHAYVFANPVGKPGEVKIEADAIHLSAFLNDLPADQPIVLTLKLIQQSLGLPHLPACTLKISSSIPVASGLGSGAAVSVAVIRAVTNFLGHTLDNEAVSKLAYEIEKRHHGTPSGIDNTVITYNKPILYQRQAGFSDLHIPVPFTLVIADTGISAPTAAVVSDVRQAWQNDPQAYERLFDQISALVFKARNFIEAGTPDQIGPLLTENHLLLKELSVSNDILDRLVDTALQAGALGAKLSGGGRGGNMIALATPEQAKNIANQLLFSGAVNTFITTVGPF
ncbi:MAG TPA: mevalonate kinase [Longilinea sp.]|nr:mevalonate kinase [Longilinea sp.]